MRPDLSRLMSKLHDAGLAADAWSEALQSLSDAIGVAGAAYITFNKITGRVDWACFSGLSEGVNTLDTTSRSTPIRRCSMRVG